MNSFIGWIGGKNYLKKTICGLMPEEMGRYIEVFGGAAWVLFYKDKHSDMEVYNDYNSDLVNLFKCVKYHCTELQRELSFMLNSRELFNDFKEQYNTRGMTDIQKAARFFMLLKTSYGSGRTSYGCVKKNIRVMSEYLERIQLRLEDVVVENRDFEDLIRIYDKKNAVIYMDPPYYGTEKYYQVLFSQQDHERLRNVAGNIQGRFLISYNDCQYVRDLYRYFNIHEVCRNNNLMNRYEDKDNTYQELVITNY